MSQHHKFPPGVSSLRENQDRPLDLLEKITLAHLAVLVIFASWYFGGNTVLARSILSLWASLGVLIAVAAFRNSDMRRRGQLYVLRWLWPLALFNVIVFLSCFNPSFREITDETRRFFVEDQPRLPLPSSARPLLSLQTLWFFDAVYLSCFNIALVIRRRRAIRWLLSILAVNALLLSIFGTIQKLAGMPGLFFGTVDFPQPYFFASFFYHNHWGAFTVLMSALSVGLVFYFSGRESKRDWRHSPAPAGIVGILLLAVTVPLSGSRSSTILIASLLSLAVLHWLARLTRQPRSTRQSIAWPVVATLTVVIAGAAFTYDMARPMIETRLEVTRQQVEDIQARGDIGSRAILYRDTWNMAKEKPWFGWGMASYPTVFYTRNTQQYSPVDGLPNYYHDAHSDWLQSLSEVGFVGTGLLALCGIVPLWGRRRILLQSPVSGYLLTGCIIIVAYAWLEFPFGNRAVICLWWVCFFSAVQYARLSRGSSSVANAPASPSGVSGS